MRKLIHRLYWAVQLAAALIIAACQASGSQ